MHMKAISEQVSEGKHTIVVMDGVLWHQPSLNQNNVTLLKMQAVIHGIGVSKQKSLSRSHIEIGLNYFNFTVSYYLIDVLTRLPTHKMKDIENLLPHKWNPA